MPKYYNEKQNLFLAFICLCSCNNKEKIENKFYVRQTQLEKEVLFENIGKRYFEKNCLACHASKGAKDNFLEQSIKSEKYKTDFLINYITKQDSLLKNRNKDALAIKEWSNNNSYLHSFNFNDREIKAILYYLNK